MDYDYLHKLFDLHIIFVDCFYINYLILGILSLRFFLFISREESNKRENPRSKFTSDVCKMGKI